MERAESMLEKAGALADSSEAFGTAVTELAAPETTDVLPPPTPELQSAIASFNDRQTQLKGMALKVTVGLVDLGRELNGIKKLVGRGNWIKWFNSPENALSCSLRTAQMYMALADYASEPAKFEAISAMDPMKAYQTAGIVKIKEVKSETASAGESAAPFEGAMPTGLPEDTEAQVMAMPNDMDGAPVFNAGTSTSRRSEYFQPPGAGAEDGGDDCDEGDGRGGGKRRSKGKGNGNGSAEKYDPDDDDLRAPPRRSLEMAKGPANGEAASRHPDEESINAYFPVIPKFQPIDYKRALKAKKKGYALVLSRANWRRELQTLLEKDEWAAKLADGFFIQMDEKN